MITNFDNWKAGLTVEEFAELIKYSSCADCTVKKYCDSLEYRPDECTDIAKRWAESEYIPPKAESPFKVGDKVKVREDLEVGKDYGDDVHFCEEMAQYKGRTVTIKEEHAPGWYRIEEDKDGGWPHTFCAEMLLPAEKTKVEQLAGIFGVSIGEKFNLRDTYGNLRDCCPYTIGAHAIIRDCDGDTRDILHRLLNGDYTVEKIPQQPEAWKPELHGHYSRVASNGKIEHCIWTGADGNFMDYAFGRTFPTYEAAEAGKADVLAKFAAIKAELGV